jgi:hypothetical protein
MSEKKLNLIQWCDQQVADGKKLKIIWDGGNDSGWLYFEIDGTEVSNEYTEFLTDYMNEELDYGSWAGDFEANGEAIYDSKQVAFVGEDFYSEIDSHSREVNIKIEIPKHLWFNQLFIGMRIDSGDDTPQADVEFNVSNGFITDDHTIVEQDITTLIEKKLIEEADEFAENHEFDGIWESVTIRPNECTVEGDNLVYNIESMNFRYRDSQEKSIYLDVQYINENFKTSNDEN